MFFPLFDCVYVGGWNAGGTHPLVSNRVVTGPDGNVPVIAEGVLCLLLWETIVPSFSLLNININIININIIVNIIIIVFSSSVPYTRSDRESYLGQIVGECARITAPSLTTTTILIIIATIFRRNQHQRADGAGERHGDVRRHRRVPDDAPVVDPSSVPVSIAIAASPHLDHDDDHDELRRRPHPLDTPCPRRTSRGDLRTHAAVRRGDVAWVPRPILPIVIIIVVVVIVIVGLPRPHALRQDERRLMGQRHHRQYALVRRAERGGCAHDLPDARRRRPRPRRARRAPFDAAMRPPSRQTYLRLPTDQQLLAPRRPRQLPRATGVYPGGVLPPFDCLDFLDDINVLNVLHHQQRRSSCMERSRRTEDTTDDDDEQSYARRALDAILPDALPRLPPPPLVVVVVSGRISRRAGRASGRGRRQSRLVAVPAGHGRRDQPPRLHGPV